jgi:rhomboid family GlyGly-CTERM serine protease
VAWLLARHEQSTGLFKSGLGPPGGLALRTGFSRIRARRLVGSVREAMAVSLDDASAWRRGAWPLALVAAGIAATVLQAVPPHALDWEPGLALRQPWRAVTAGLVHWSGQHLLMNLVGAAGLALLGWRAALGPRAVAAWALAWPLTQFGLLVQPALRHYGGLSGVLHAAAAIAAASLLARPADRRNRLVGGLLVAGLVVKVLLEQPWAAATQVVDGWDFALAPVAHASGAVAGLVAWALVGRERSP